MSIARLFGARTAREGAYLLSGLPLGVAWLSILATGWLTALGLIPTLIGLPLLLVMAYVTHGLAAAERAMARPLLRARLAPARRPLEGGLLRRLRIWVADGAAWRELAYVSLRGTLGIASGTLVLALAAASLGLIAAPAYYWTSADVLDAPFWDVDTLPEALALVPVGLLGALLTALVIRGLAVAWRAAAEGMLGRPGQAPTPAPAAVTGARRRRAPTPRRALWIQAGITAGIVLLLTVIWAVTTPGGYFWPVWAMLGLGLPLAIHALAVLVPATHPARRRGLEIHAGVAGILFLFLTLIWAITTPGGYFWPVWVALGLAIPVGIHALLARGGGPDDRAELTERVETLTSSRAGAVDAQAAELRRIERDLHDGAQARLVALAMDLGMAREKLATEPADAEALMVEAHEKAKRALVELRDLARGIHPAVLSDRGLDAALSALAAGSPVPVDVDVEIEERLPPAVEGAAYFVVAESITNAAKHSGASAVRLHVAREGGALVVEVADDGAGGADPAGGGLRGLRSRVEALDGRLSVASPHGGGTLVRAELPCAS
jgi:signal transduction histidine kinase